MSEQLADSHVTVEFVTLLGIIATQFSKFGYALVQ